jgi:hypothetical protein
MPLGPALEAYLIATFALCHLSFLGFSNEVSAVRTGAPFQVRISVYINVLLKL